MIDVRVDLTRKFIDMARDIQRDLEYMYNNINCFKFDNQYEQITAAHDQLRLAHLQIDNVEDSLRTLLAALLKEEK